jgi:hypothetical protein
MFSISKYISLPVFILSFFFGLVAVYFLGPEKKSVLVFPTPDSYRYLQYKDGADQCFQFTPTQVKCPMNPLSIKTIPIQ